MALSPAQDIPAEAVLDMIDATFPLLLILMIILVLWLQERVPLSCNQSSMRLEGWFFLMGAEALLGSFSACIIAPEDHQDPALITFDTSAHQMLFHQRILAFHWADRFKTKVALGKTLRVVGRKKWRICENRCHKWQGFVVSVVGACGLLGRALLDDLLS